MADTGGSVGHVGTGDGARRLDRGSPLPLWAQLRADLRRRLDAGAFDDEFPGELALVEEYGVSRHTVRSALSGLEADFIHIALYHELATRAGVRLAGGHEHVRAVVPSGAQQRLLDLPGSVGALAIDRLGYVGDRPIEWRHTLIRGDRFSLIADFSHRTGYQMYLDSRYRDVSRAS